MGNNKKILIVDDEPLNIKLLAAILSEFNYEILTAPDGREAIDLTYANYPDLILLDVMMPMMDGYEVTRRLKADAQTQQIPIILITGMDGANLKTIGHEAGADDFLNKPVNITELRSRVKSLLSLKEYNDRIRNLNSETAIEKNETTLLFNGSEKPQSVIVALSNPKESKLINMYLYGQPFMIEQVHTIGDAVARAETDPVDLILLDLNLTQGENQQAIERLEYVHKDRSVQILAICGSGDLDADVSDIVSWADDFLVRPINVHELRARVSAQLKKKSLHDAFYANINKNIESVLTDKVTELYNRGYFDHFLHREIRKTHRYGVPVTLILLKVPESKPIDTDTDDSPIKESDLKKLADIIKKNIREVDIGARFSEGRFALVLPNTNIEGAHIVFERIRRLIREQFPADVLHPRMKRISIGISGCPGDGGDVVQLVDKAERSASPIF